ncbi:tartrate/fumarate subfamily Fe-S type hydro-lyase subunit beta [Candidatus Omnitrophus magneticus]|uniref:Tartrate/fumarate subfamily Fe-S type hydro-lyase subunit beta n=1 Tax=Candidatus Omnitrophus magneticus TaxID=1609969 RepID=A0A0F0CP46_9BACT|nr:tartrate/fumarate subfamily Fe-S type hydro-lyase subunit beta [Candidatus Omnitrophus magneticus]
MDKIIQVPFIGEEILKLNTGEKVLLTGTILTARDAAHARMIDLINKKEPVPIDFKNQVVYYCGPTPALKGRVIGSCGPTTSSRMDKFTPELLKHGLKGMIGKGKRNEEVRRAIKENKAIYFVAPAGAGAYLSTLVKSARVIAFEDLGPEAIYELKIENFPVITAIDTKGNDIYKEF